MRCLRCYVLVEKIIGSKFEQYGGFVARHPWKFIIGYILITSSMGIGLIRLKSENDIERVFTPMNSQASKDRTTLSSLFDDLSGSNFYTQSQLTSGQYADIIFKTRNGENILNNTLLAEAETSYNSLYSFTFTNSAGGVSSFADICAIRSSACVVSGSEFFTMVFKTLIDSNSVGYPIVNGIQVVNVFGNIRHAGGVLQHASLFKLRFYLRTDTSAMLANGKLWIDEFLTHAKGLSAFKLDIAYAHSDSLSEELNTNIGGDIKFFALTFTLMCVYASFATANFKCLSDRQNLAKAAVLGTALSIVAALGICSACGVEFVSIVGVMPFLIIGIGVDDMFLLLSGLADTYGEKGTFEPIDKVKMTMRSSGVGITITSLTDLIAFLVGVASPFLAVRNFCIYTGVAVFFCYINYVTFFLACIALNEKRVLNGLHCMTCRPVPAPKEQKVQPHSCMCTGSLPDRREDVEGPLEKYPPKCIAGFVLLTPVKVIVLFMFAVYLGVSIWGATQFQQGLVVKQLVNEESYYFKYSEFQDNFNDDSIPIGFNMIGNIQYSDDQIWLKIVQLEAAAKVDHYVHSINGINWLSSYKQSGFYDNSSDAVFISHLRNMFLPNNPSFINDIAFNSDNTSIKASRFYVFSDDIPDSTAEGNLMLRMRDIASASTLPKVIAYAPAFIFYEQYVIILKNTLQTLGIAIVAIFVITSIFLPHPVLVIFVTITLAMILVGLIGFMYFWDLTLSSVTMTHMIMSVGFSVDFSAHICHGFMETGATSRNEGARGALQRSGGPIFNGAVSSIVGIVMLAFSKSFIFFSFFKVMLLIMLFGAAHSLFFLPVVLSLIGPSFEPSEVSSEVELKGNDISHNNNKSSESIYVEDM